MNPLASRKQLLIAESELNRAQLVHEWRTVKGKIHALAESAKTVHSIASAVATLLAGLANCRRKATSPAAEKPSWLQTILKGAAVVGTLWQTFRATNCEQTDK